MGIFDDIFGTKTADATAAATAAGQAGIQQGVGRANHVLDQTTANASNDFRAGAAGATDAINQNYGQARTDLTNYGAKAQGLLSSGIGSAVNTVQGSNTNYAPYVTSGGAASGMLSNALGLNGAGGNAAATAAFQADPGYAYQRDQATDAAARKAASLGISASGNTLTAIDQLSSNLANQGYGSWLDRLSGMGSQGLTAANAVSGNNQAAAGYQATGGTTGAQLASTLGANLGTLGTNQGNQLGTISSNLGTNLGNAQLQLGQLKSGNITGGALTSANLGVQGAEEQDSAANANSGIISSALGKFLAPEIGAATSKVGGLFSSATGGFL